MKRPLLLAALVVVATAGASHASVIVVDCSGAGDFLTLREGIDAAVNGDTVRVAPGAYSGPDNRDLDFGGKAITVASESGPRVTIIDCQNAGRAFDFHSAEPMAARLSGLTVMNGAADEGGAIRCRSGSRPTIDGCVLSGNWGATQGGALYVVSSAGPILTNVVFDDNESGGRGGAISTRSGRTVVDGCTFHANSAPDGGAMFLYYDMYVIITDCVFTGNRGRVGGAIYDFGSSPSVTGSTFTDNHVSGDEYNFGGGMQTVNSNSTIITDCMFTDNSANGYVGFGGGLSVHMAKALVSGCVFSGNTVTGELGGIGGGVYCYNEDDNWGPPSEFTDCTFSGNTGDQGGGLCCENTSAPIRECAFSRNRGHHGGGAYLAHHGGQFEDCVVFDNESPEYRGGGMYIWACTSLIRNVTVCGNAAPEGGGIYCSSAPRPHIGNSIVAFNESGSGIGCSPDGDGPLLECCDVFGNVGGDWVGCIAGLSGVNGNLCEDPHFCGADEGDFSIDASSPCAPAHSPLCGLIGALGIGCETSAVRPMSWGGIKAKFR
jgi:predicted outer membrane repeat protein